MSLLDVSMLAYIHQISSLDFNRGGSPKGPRCVGLVSFDSVSLNPNFSRDISFKGPRCAGRGGGFGPYCAAAAAY